MINELRKETQQSSYLLIKIHSVARARARATVKAAVKDKAAAKDRYIHIYQSSTYGLESFSFRPYAAVSDHLQKWP